MPVATLALLLAAGPPAVKKYDQTYAVVAGEALQLDFAAPPGPGPHPCVVCLHGGAWKGGSRKDLSRPALWADFGPAGALPRADTTTGDLTAPLRTNSDGPSLLDVLAARGYAAVSVSYRLAPKHKFPAQIVDVATAVRHLRANAATYHIDPDRIAVCGFSAGGHLGSLLATAAGRVPEFVGPLYPEQPNAVRAVVNFFGPADLTLYEETPGIEQTALKPLFGGDPAGRHARYVQASPVTHASASSPPFLHQHGTADIIVPILHSERLHEKLKAAGVESELVRLKGKGHGWFGPDLVRSLDRAVAFLDRHLKGKS
jgi:acetyl esterase/lipase